jgi:hypothetical protein
VVVEVGETMIEIGEMIETEIDIAIVIVIETETESEKETERDVNGNETEINVVEMTGVTGSGIIGNDQVKIEIDMVGSAEINLTILTRYVHAASVYVIQLFVFIK